MTAMTKEVALRDSKDVWFTLGFACQKGNDLPGAEKAYRRALELTDEPYPVQINLAIVLSGMGRGAEAAAVAKEASSRNPNDLFAANNYGADLLMKGRYQEAVAVLRPLVERNPGFPMGRLNLGRAYLGLGEYERVIEAVRQVTDSMPQNPEAWGLLGTAYGGAGRASDAVDAFQKVTDLVPKNGTAWAQYGDALWSVRRGEEAERAYRRAIELAPKEPAAWNGLGGMFFKQGRTAEAREAFGHAVELDPNWATALHNMGALELRAQQPDRAADWFRKTLAANPDDVTAVWGLCQALLGSGQSDEALALAEQQLKRQPESASLLGCRAVVHVERGELQQAEADYTSALERAADGESRRGRAYVRAQSGNTDGAVADLRRAIETDPNDAYAALFLWVVENGAGHADAAESAVRDLEQRADPNAWSTKILRYCGGKLTADELVAAAADDGQHCEAYYYIGEHTRVEDGADAARPWFQKCVDVKMVDYTEHRLAQWRLAQQ